MLIRSHTHTPFVTHICHAYSLSHAHAISYTHVMLIRSHTRAAGIPEQRLVDDYVTSFKAYVVGVCRKG